MRTKADRITPGWSFRILGPIEVSYAGTALALGGPRHLRLLAVLLVHAGEPVGVGRLIEALWGEEPPRTAATMLHVRISELRTALRAGQREPAARIVTRRSGYVLQVGADEVDAGVFERLAAAGREALTSGDHERAGIHLRDALELWRGPPLAEVADQPFAVAEATRLEGLRMQALEDRIEVELALGRHGAVIVELEALVGEHPLRERLWLQLMLACYRAGRQGEALRAFGTVRSVLDEHLGIEPGIELQRLHTAVLRQDPALELRSVSPGDRGREPPGNLPAQLTSFVGREPEVADVRRLLRDNRLVTLTGAGGVGKSRLGVEAAATLRTDTPGGTWLVELAALDRPGLVPHQVADTLGVCDQPGRRLPELLAERVGAASVLLVFDNCEHVIDEVSGLAQQLLGACARLRILATSRERLGITGEVLLPVSGLTVPEPGARGAPAIGGADAVRLLVERAASVQPGFVLRDDTAAALAQVCQRLDGLPLALELAAARVNAYGIEQIAARLDDRFALLTQGSRSALARHQTLRAMVDWSYGLLNEPERRLFDRLSVFVGGFALEAVEGEEEAAVELLGRLVDKSLVVAEPAGAGAHRYRLLETLRAYAHERLAERGETLRAGIPEGGEEGLEEGLRKAVLLASVRFR